MTDVKEGTTGGELRDNEPVSAGDDAISVHAILEGWGAGNRFVGDSFRLARQGYAVHLVGAAEEADNVVGCGQSMTPSGVGEISNVACR